MKTNTIYKKAFALLILIVTMFTLLASGVVTVPVQASAASNSPRIEVQVHCQDTGWMSVKSGDEINGTVGQSKRLEFIKTRLVNGDGGIKMSTHQANKGWVGYSAAPSGRWCGSGTVGESRAIESVKMELYGNIAKYYSIEYRIHQQNLGWSTWKRDGNAAGETGRSLRGEAIQVRLVAKSGRSIVNTVTSLLKPSLKYKAHIQNIGDTNYVTEGNYLGTVGKALRLEGFGASLTGPDGKSAITYRAHVSDVGWQNWKTSTQMAGTQGQSKAIECFEIKLTGEYAKYYDIYYRVHVEDFGTLGWARNGEKCGTVGGGYRIEGIELRLVKKGSQFNRGGVAYKDLTNSVLVTAANINAAAAKYGIGTNTNAYAALKSINSKYLSRVSDNKNGTNLFFFEGCGNNSSASRRMNAMCVVVKNRQIVYIDLNSSTIPDDPFNPSKNGGDPMPTLKSGVYNFSTVNHRGSYAGLNVNGARVVRHYNRTNYYNSTSSGINVHKRSANTINHSWVNSAGCLIVGSTPSNSSGYTNEYARFIQAVGIVGSNGRSNQTYTNWVSGKIVIDRNYAGSYLSNIGYTSGAISAIG